MLDVVVGLFIPVYHREAKVKDCLKSLACLAPLDSIGLHVRVGFNGGPDSLKKYLVDEVQNTLDAADTYDVYDPGSNIGKPQVVNAMVNQLSETFPLDYVLSMDSDIIVQDPLWLEKFLQAYKEFPDPGRLGCLSAQQLGHCCHALRSEPIIFKSGHYTYVTGAYNEGVAGGAILTPYRVWRDIGGYRAKRVYASDDAHYALDCHLRNLLMCIVNEVAVQHPYGDEPGYVDWKVRAARGEVSADESKGFYE